MRRPHLYCGDPDCPTCSLRVEADQAEQERRMNRGLTYWDGSVRRGER